MSPECDFAKERLVEMLWVAATEPELFAYDVVRKQRLDEILTKEADEVLAENPQLEKGLIESMR